MKQFTSRIDFSLTKKRFLMMGNEFSPIRSSSKSILSIFFISVVSFVFCTQTEINSDELYTNVQLQLVSSPYQQVQDSGSYHNSKMYDLEGKLFTGTQNYFFKKNDQLFTSVTFKKGIRTKEQTFKKSGEEWYRVEIEYDFEKDERISFRGYDLGTLTLEIIDSSSVHSGMHLYREWHPNGLLKFESTSNELGSQGLMTLYDQNGNILEQELYNDGELVEKIK